MKAVAYDPNGRKIAEGNLRDVLEVVRVRVGPRAYYSKTSKRGRTILHIGGCRIEVL